MLKNWVVMTGMTGMTGLASPEYPQSDISNKLQGVLQLVLTKNVNLKMI